MSSIETTPKPTASTHRSDSPNERFRIRGADGSLMELSFDAATYSISTGQGASKIQISRTADSSGKFQYQFQLPNGANAEVFKNSTSGRGSFEAIVPPAPTPPSPTPPATPVLPERPLVPPSLKLPPAPSFESIFGGLDARELTHPKIADLTEIDGALKDRGVILSREEIKGLVQRGGAIHAEIKSGFVLKNEADGKKVLSIPRTGDQELRFVLETPGAKYGEIVLSPAELQRMNSMAFDGFKLIRGNNGVALELAKGFRVTGSVGSIDKGAVRFDSSKAYSVDDRYVASAVDGLVVKSKQRLLELASQERNTGEYESGSQKPSERAVERLFDSGWSIGVNKQGVINVSRGELAFEIKDSQLKLTYRGQHVLSERVAEGKPFQHIGKLLERVDRTVTVGGQPVTIKSDPDLFLVLMKKNISEILVNGVTCSFKQGSEQITLNNPLGVSSSLGRLALAAYLRGERSTEIAGAALPPGFERCVESYDRCKTKPEIAVNGGVVSVTHSGRSPVSLDLSRFNDLGAADRALAQAIRGRRSIIEAETVFKLPQGSNVTKEGILGLVTRARNLGEAELRRGEEKKLALQLGGALKLTSAESSVLSTPLLHQLMRMEQQVPGCLGKLEQGDFARLVEMMLGSISKERQRVSENVVLNKDTVVAAVIGDHMTTNQTHGKTLVENFLDLIDPSGKHSGRVVNLGRSRDHEAKKRVFLQHVQECAAAAVSGKSAWVMVESHGNSDGLHLDIGTNRLHVAELASAILKGCEQSGSKNADLSKLFMFSSSCFSADIQRNLYREIVTQAEKRGIDLNAAPAMFAGSSRGNVGWMTFPNSRLTAGPGSNPLIELVDQLRSKRDGAERSVRMRDLFSVERRMESEYYGGEASIHNSTSGIRLEETGRDAHGQAPTILSDSLELTSDILRALRASRGGSASSTLDELITEAAEKEGTEFQPIEIGIRPPNGEIL